LWGPLRLGTARHRPGPENSCRAPRRRPASAFLTDAGATFPSATATWEEQSCSVVPTYPSHRGTCGVGRRLLRRVIGSGRSLLWVGPRPNLFGGWPGPAQVRSENHPRLRIGGWAAGGLLTTGSRGHPPCIHSGGVQTGTASCCPGPDHEASAQGTSGLGEDLWRDVTAARSAVTAATITRSCSGRALRWPPPLQM
jgi:hypothetical protein